MHREKKAALENQKIILFDGVCNLCSGAVQFFINIDKKEVLKFSSLQSDFGQKVLLDNNLNAEDFDSFLFKDGDKIYEKSNAALQIFKTLGGWWKVVYFLKIIPRPFRDWIYKLAAKNRYRWFGKQDSCWLPTPELRARFL